MIKDRNDPRPQSADCARGISVPAYWGNMKQNNRLFNTRRLVVLSLFCAIAYVSVFMLRISGIGGFLTFDIKDMIMTIAAMHFGPLAGALIALTVSLLEMVTVSGTGPWGFLMNFVSSTVFVCCASTVYRYFPVIKKRIIGAVTGLGIATVLMTAVMLVMNLVVTPIYMKISVDVVKGMLLPVLLPFNLIKATLNSSLVMMLYKPVTTALKKARLIDVKEGETASYRLRGKSLIVFIVGAVVAAACVALLIAVFGGEIDLIRQPGD